jgi:hypothetical protein
MQEQRRCYGCGQIGHIQTNCPKLKRKRVKGRSNTDKFQRKETLPDACFSSKHDVMAKKTSMACSDDIGEVLDSLCASYRSDTLKIPRQELGDLLGHQPRILHRTILGALSKGSQIWRCLSNLGRYLPPLSLLQVFQKMYHLWLRDSSHFPSWTGNSCRLRREEATNRRLRKYTRGAVEPGAGEVEGRCDTWSWLRERQHYEAECPGWCQRRPVLWSF